MCGGGGPPHPPAAWPGRCPARGAWLPSPLRMKPLVVRVLPEVAAIDKTFDYLVPEHLRDQVRVGDVVPTSSSTVGGSVAGSPRSGGGAARRRGPATARQAQRAGPPGRSHRPGRLGGLALGRTAGGLPEDGLTAQGRGPLARDPRAGTRPPAPEHDLLRRAFEEDRAVLRLPPATNLVHVALAAAAKGNALVLCPRATQASQSRSRPPAGRCGGGVHPVDWAGAPRAPRSWARGRRRWAPVAELAAVVVLDEHDEAPPAGAVADLARVRLVGAERRRPSRGPVRPHQPVPHARGPGVGHAARRRPIRDRAGWPSVEVADRRDEDPGRAGLFSPPLCGCCAPAARPLRPEPDRPGPAAGLAACGALARCERCEAAVVQPERTCACPRCGTGRPLCLHCGAAAVQAPAGRRGRGCATISRRWSASRCPR